MSGQVEAGQAVRSVPRSLASPVSRLLWPALGLFALLGFNGLTAEGFFTIGVVDGHLYGPLVTIVVQASPIILVAIGMTLVIATGGIDLSVGSVMAIAGAAAAIASGYGGALGGLLAGLLAGIAVGLANGVLVSFVRIQPIIATLIFLVLGRGLAMMMTGGVPAMIEAPFLARLGPFAPLIAAIVFAVTLLFVRRTALGLFVASVGDNEEASRLSGLQSGLIKLVVYAFSGLCAAVAGIVVSSRLGRADATRLGELVELDAIFAVVVGGTALTGGRFSLAGSVIGALLIQTLTVTMINQGMPPEITPLPKAIVILLVCLLQSEKFRRQVAAPFRGRKEASA